MSTEPSYLIHHRDSKFSTIFDQIIAAQQIQVIHTPVRAPNANADAERCIQSIREECLNDLIVLNRQHWERILVEYARFYNQRRPHQGLHNRLPEAQAEARDGGAIHRCQVPGGIIHDYYREAA